MGGGDGPAEGMEVEEMEEEGMEGEVEEGEEERAGVGEDQVLVLFRTFRQPLRMLL